MLNFISNIIAGFTMSVQGVMNTRLGEKTGILEANAFVQGTAFVLSFIIALVFGKGNIMDFAKVPWYYLLGGVLGTVITVTVMLGIGKISPALAISVILISQLLTASLIDSFGLMGTEKTTFGFSKVIGLCLMAGGVIVFKFF